MEIGYTLRMIITYGFVIFIILAALFWLVYIFIYGMRRFMNPLLNRNKGGKQYGKPIKEATDSPGIIRRDTIRELEREAPEPAGETTETRKQERRETTRNADTSSISQSSDIQHRPDKSSVPPKPRFA